MDKELGNLGDGTANGQDSQLAMPQQGLAQSGIADGQTPPSMGSQQGMAQQGMAQSGIADEQMSQSMGMGPQGIAPQAMPQQAIPQQAMQGSPISVSPVMPQGMPQQEMQPGMNTMQAQLASVPISPAHLLKDQAIPSPLLVPPPVVQPQEPVVQPSQSKTRILGVDVARAVAIIGMILAHMGSSAAADRFPASLLHIGDGRASTLFVLVAGVGVGLLCSRRSAGQSFARLFYRGVILFGIGVALSSYSTIIAVILQYYCFYLLIAWVGAQMPTWLLGLVIPIYFVGGPTLIYLNGVNMAVSDFFLGMFGISLDGNPNWVLTIFHEGLVSGMYPALAYGAPVLLGVLLSRLDFTDKKVFIALQTVSLLIAVIIYVGGSALGFAAAVGEETSNIYPWLILTPHSSTVLTVIAESASAVFAFAFCITVSSGGGLSKALSVFGKMALSVYVFHVILTELLYKFFGGNPEDFDPNTPASGGFAELILFIGMISVCFAFSFIMHKLFHKGPIELIVDLPNALIDKTFKPRSKRAKGPSEPQLSRLEQLDLQAKGVQ